MTKEPKKGALRRTLNDLSPDTGYVKHVKGGALEVSFAGGVFMFTKAPVGAELLFALERITDHVLNTTHAAH